MVKSIWQLNKLVRDVINKELQKHDDENWTDTFSE